MGFRYLLVAVLVICLVMDITAAHTKAGKGASKGGASKGGTSKGGASKGGASKGGASKGGASKGEKEAICDPGCSNGGSCVAPNTCQCAAGYKGSQCEIAICDPECSNGGSCVAPNTCQCVAGYKGSQCETEPVPSFTVCYGDIQQEGQITTPMYMGNYPSGMGCKTIITAGTGQIVKLTFLEFEFEYDSACSLDFVALYDGVDKNSNRLGLFCGTSLPGEIVSTGQNLYLYFATNFAGNYKGFKADIHFIQGTPK